VTAGRRLVTPATFLLLPSYVLLSAILEVMYANAPYTMIQRAVHIHPTVTELIPTMLGELKPLE
jgi:uncharacterized membrane protein YecN with MAPEG domain